MYSFQANTGRRKNKHLIRLLSVIIFILVIALIGVGISFARIRSVSDATSEALTARALSESSEAQSAVYRLTQSSGTNTMTLLSTVRGHVYALQCINTIAANIYGAGTSLVDGSMVTACLNTITQCEARMQAGGVLTTSFTELRDQVDAIVAAFNTPAQ